MFDCAQHLRVCFTPAWALMIAAQTGLAQGQVAAQLEFEERCHLPQGEYLKRVLPQPKPITNLADLQDKEKMRKHSDVMLRLAQEMKDAGPAALRQVTGADITVEQRPIMVISFDEVRD